MSYVGVNYLKIDITNLRQLIKRLKGSFSHVINLGGYVRHSVFRNSRNQTTKTHFIGLVNLIRIPILRFRKNLIY